MKTEAIIVVCVAILIFLQGYFTSDEAFKYVNPYVLFWIKGIIGGLAAGGLALKAFMSTAFSDSRKKEIPQQPQPPAQPAQPQNQ